MDDRKLLRTNERCHEHRNLQNCLNIPLNFILITEEYILSRVIRVDPRNTPENFFL